MKAGEFSQYAGREIGVSRWKAVDQERVNVFAEVTEDRQAIHLDADAAAHSIFGGTVAHGFLVLSLLSAMLEDAVPPFEDRGILVNYGFDKIRFVSPVLTGARIRGKFTLIESVVREPGVYLNRLGVVVEVEHQSKPGLVAEWLTLERTTGAAQEKL